MDSLPGSTAIKIIGISLTTVLSWRIWRFTLRPRLYPHEPKEYPYRIPFIGHVGGFFSDFNGAIEKGRRHFHPSQEPFTMIVAGQTIYVATSAEDVNGVWRNSKAMAMDPIAMDMFVQADMSKKSRELLFEVFPDAQYNAANGRPLAPIDMSNEIHRQQLSGPRLDSLVREKTIPSILKQMKALETSHPAVTSRSAGSFTVSLLELCTSFLLTEATNTFFGPKLLQTAPDLPEAFKSWEQSNWKFLFQVPGIFAKDMLKAKATMETSFTNYFKLPRSERPGSSYYIEKMEDMLREVGLKENDMAKFTFLQYWAIIGNVYKLAFWLLAHVVTNTTLLEEIRQETLPAIKGNSIDDQYLLKECPKLESTFNEILRLTVSSSLARVVMETTVVGGKTLQPGNKIMLPIQPLHLDPTVWGRDVSTFNANRFQDNAKLSKSQSFRPWGGGHTLCPGRFLARRSVNVMVALLLSRYDLTVESAGFRWRTERSRLLGWF